MKRLQLHKILFLFIPTLILTCSSNPVWVIYNTKNTPIKTDLIRQIILQKDRLSWVGTYGDGLYQVNGNRWGKVGNIFRGEYILTLKENKGAFWIGTARDGAWCFKDNGFLHMDTSSGLCGNNVWDICFRQNEEILFCSRYSGITQWNGNSSVCIGNHSGLPDNEVTLAETDKSNRLWIGTARSGLCGILNTDTLRVHRGTGISGNYIRAILCDSTLRYVGSWDGGLDYFNGRCWEQIAAVGKPVVVLRTDDLGHVWAGTWGMGVYMQDGSSWKVLNSENRRIAG